MTDMSTAVGSSEELRIVPSPLPTFGIDMLNRSGGRMTPKTPRTIAYLYRPPPINVPSMRNLGGNMRLTTINAHVDMSMLFVSGGTSIPTRPLKKIKAVKLIAASNPQIIPGSGMENSFTFSIPAARSEPPNRIKADSHLLLAGIRRSSIHSANRPIHEN